MRILTYLVGAGLIASSLAACDDESGSVHDAIEAGSNDDNSSADAAQADDPSSDDPSSDAGDDAGQDSIPDLHDVPTEGGAGEIMCAELGSVCHAYDSGDGELGDRCHDVGHLGDADACAEIYDECIAFCQQPVEGGLADAGDEHAHADGGSAMCEELGHVCHDVSVGIGPDCHDVGHAGDAHECAEVYDECIDFCQGDAGASHDEQADAAAGQQDHAEAGSAMCEELGHVCHDVSRGIGPDCHEIGHAGDSAECAGVYDDCMAFCQSDAGAVHLEAGSGADAALDAATDAGR